MLTTGGDRMKEKQEHRKRISKIRVRCRTKLSCTAAVGILKQLEVPNESPGFGGVFWTGGLIYGLFPWTFH